MRRVLSSVILALLALFYACGAVIHLANIFGLTTFDWLAAPRKWQVLDVVYLMLDLAVAAWLLFRPPLGVALLIVAAAGQVLLYTVLRDWILDVPEEFAPTKAERGHLDALVRFHLLSMVAAGAALWLRR